MSDTMVKYLGNHRSWYTAKASQSQPRTSVKDLTS